MTYNKLYRKMEKRWKAPNMEEWRGVLGPECISLYHVHLLQCCTVAHKDIQTLYINEKCLKTKTD